MKRPNLVHLAVEILPEAEDLISIVIENLCGQTPSIYADQETGRCTASVYLKAAECPAKVRPVWARTLQQEGAVAVTWGQVRHEDWAESWKKHFHPMEFGKALLVKPSWSKQKLKKGQALVILDPGLSFGTGQHATTSFCLEQIVQVRTAGEKQTFLDIGTGSGILAIAAAKLGYAKVVAFDFDPESVRVSRENVLTNRVEKIVKPQRRDLTQLPLKSATRFSLVCANLIYDLLLQEAERIVNRLQPAGHLVLAGILITQFPQVQKRFEKLGLKLVAAKEEKEWKSGRFVFAAK